MPEIDTMRQDAQSVAHDSTIGLILNEMLQDVDAGRVFFRPGNNMPYTLGLYANGTLPATHAYVAFKEADLPSFLHELTHARCVFCYQKESINYAPGGANAVVPAYANVPNGSAPNFGAAVRPPGLGTMSNATEYRAGWHRDRYADLYRKNLKNLESWVPLVDFTPPDPFMSPAMKREMKELDKKADKAKAKGRQTLPQDDARFSELYYEQMKTGVVQKSRKTFGAKAINAQRTRDERERKRQIINERIAYGLLNLHNEYDTVVNQMLYLMHLWGFKWTVADQLDLQEVHNHCTNKTVPGSHLFKLIDTLAREAYNRRLAADPQSVLDGAAPEVQAPTVLINPVI